MKTATILGAVTGTNNIGDAIAEKFSDKMWRVATDDCHVGGNEYAPPKIEDFPWYEDSDVLVVTVGKTGMTPFHQISHEEIQEVIQGSLILPIQAVSTYVRARGDRGGKVILIGSYAHRHPFSTGTSYCAAKAGIDMAAKNLAWELTGLGFYINVVHPYHVFGTPMWEKVQEGVMKNKQMTRAEADEYAMKDMQMKPANTAVIADIVYEVATTESFAWTSGSGIEVFGGTR